jgi:hypothetical protein
MTTLIVGQLVGVGPAIFVLARLLKSNQRYRPPTPFIIFRCGGRKSGCGAANEYLYFEEDGAYETHSMDRIDRSGVGDVSAGSVPQGECSVHGFGQLGYGADGIHISRRRF